jgi:TetR/AcrR family fatty acid metabolism transcriptional regulator
LPRPDVSTARKAQILQAAMNVFARKGFTATRMEEIAAETGLSVGILYWYFKGKEEITLALLDQLYTSDLQNVRQLLTQSGSCRARLWGYMAENLQAEEQWLALSLELRSQAARNPRLQASLQGVYQQYHQLLVELFTQGMACGELRPLNSEAAAALVLAVYDGLLYTVAQIYPAPATPEVWTPFIRQAFDLLFDGWENPAATDSS